jgi:hypothetical protein
MPRVKMFTMMMEGGKERGAPGDQKTPNYTHEVNTCWSIFIYAQL